MLQPSTLRAQGASDLTPPPGARAANPAATPRATPSTPPPAPPRGSPATSGSAFSTTEHGVAFEAIDEASVRVFAVAGVGTETVRGRYQSRVVGIPEAGHGTGVVVDPRGVIVTARHVVEGARHVAVRFPGDGPVVPAVVVYEDTDQDFAILLASSSQRLSHVVPLPTDAPALAVRQSVFAIGYPLDADRRQPQSSRGIISGVLDDGQLQLDIAVNPGNSGGPLLDERGGLVGIVVARGRIEMGAQGIGIAVPIARIRLAYDQVLRGGALSSAYDRLRDDALSRTRIAQVVDAIVRLGGVALLAEAADFVDDPRESALLDRFRRLAERTDDPDLLGLLSAFFWNAAQVMVERAGGAPTPEQLAPGPVRNLADQLWRLAFELAARARELDPSITQRSEFIAYLTPAGGSGARASGWHPPANDRRSRAKKGWAPFVMLGFAHEFDLGGNGLGLDVYFPFGPRYSDASTRVAFVIGGGAAIYFGGGEYATMGGGPGLALRFGKTYGVTALASYNLGAAWSDGARTLSGDSEVWFRPVGAAFGLSVKLGPIHVGASFRFAFDVDLNDGYFTLVAPSVGGVF